MSLTDHVDEATITKQSDSQYAAIAVVSLRLIMGWLFLYSGITKVLDPEWTASGYLLHGVAEGNPFADVWTVLAGTPLVDILFQFGLTLVGLGLILGAFTRWNAFWGSVMMLLVWAISFPLENGIVVDEHMVYIAVLFGLSAMDAGHVAGLDPYLASTLAKDIPWLRYLMS
jgi:thiosulfate dehydrogenase [quinone] large subunit